MEIQGYGGKGGGGPRAPVESPDSLQSKATARVVDLISEGEIVGLVDGARSIYLDDTPLMDDNGNLNFKGVSYATRSGVQQQSYIENFSDVENTTNVGVRVKADTPFIRRINNLNVNKARITLGIPSLTQTNPTTGDVSGTSVQVRFSVSANGGAYVPLIATIRQKTYTPSQVGSVTAGGSKVRFYWTRPNDRANNSYSYSDTGSSSGNTMSLTRSETRAVTVQVAVKAYRNGSTSPDQTQIINLTGQSDGTTSLHVAEFVFQRFASLFGKYSYSVEIVSGEGSVSLVDVPTIEMVDTAHTITGKSTSRYQRSFLIPLAGTGPWDIKVERLTADSTTQTLQNQTYVDAISEIVEAKLKYPNSALIALEVDASQFTSVPTRGYDVKLLKVKIPSNYNPLTRQYTGNWDGTFKVDWTDNPAWCFYDLVTNSRYGLGTFIPEAQVDKWMLYKIAQYCDGMVPDGKGGIEPRMTCNLYLGSRDEAFKVINDMASIFRGIVYWSSGSITCVQDAPTTASFAYSPANVIDGTFTYTGSSSKARHTVALVSWNDPADGYKQKVEYVEDQFGVAKFGIVSTEVAAVGCTSQGQARRLGQWMLIAERNESEVVVFKVGMDGAIARPGDVIKIADPARAGIRYGGRLLSATSTVLGLDSAISLTAGQKYTISVVGSDGKIVEATYTSNGQNGSTLTLPAALPQTPLPGSMWVLSTDAVQAQLFRVIGITEDERNQFTITALAYEPQKYNAAEYGNVIQPASISTLNAAPDAPSSLTAAESLYVTGDGVKNKLIVSWTPVPFATSYVTTYRTGENNKSPEVSVNTPTIEVPDVITGLAYTIEVAAINSLGLQSQASTITYTPVGKSFPPSNVNNFRVSRLSETLRFTWDHISDIDLDRYEIRLGNSWASGIIITSTAGNTADVLSARGGSFMIRAVDTSGSYSNTEAVVIVPDYNNINVVVRYDDSLTGFNGSHQGTTALVSAAPQQWTNTKTWNDYLSWDQMVYSGGVTVTGYQPWSTYNQPWSSYTTPWLFLEPATTGTYTLNPIDLGYLTSATLSVETVISSIQRDSQPWSALQSSWSSYALPNYTWVKSYDAYLVNFEVATSLDGAIYSDWKPFIPGAYTFRYLKIRVKLGTDNPAFLPFLQSLIVNIDVPDRVQHFNDVAVPSTGVTLSFNPQFIAVRTVQVTLQNAVQTDRFVVSGKSSGSVTITIYDVNGNPKAGLIDVDVFGYGERS